MADDDSFLPFLPGGDFDAELDEEFDDDDLDEDEDEDDDGESVYFKYVFEGAATVGELVAALRQVADGLEAKAAEGWRLAEPVENGWAHLVSDA